MKFSRRQILENHLRLAEREAAYRRHGYDSRRAIRFVLSHLRPAPARVLEIGTGKGRFLTALARRSVRVVTVDPDAAEQRFARLNAAYAGVGRRIRFVVADGADLPFADASFDAVVSMNALHHIRNLDGVLDEVVRVLRPGGLVLLADFDAAGFRIFDRLHREEGRTHERFRYRWPHVLARLRAAGLAARILAAAHTRLAITGPPGRARRRGA